MPIRPQSRDAIVEAAFQVLNRDPSATLADIAQQAGVGRATLHRHFAGRDDLLAAVAQTAIREMDEAVDAAVRDVPTYGEALRVSLEVILPLADRYWFLSRAPAELDPSVSAAYDRQMAELTQAVDGAKAEGLFDADIPTAWIVQTYDHLIYAAWESIRDGEIAPNQAASLAWRTLIQGLGSSTDDR